MNKACFSYSSWGSHGKYTGVVCHSLRQWTTFCQKSLLWPIHLGWSCTTWLIISLSYISPFTMARQWPGRNLGMRQAIGLKTVGHNWTTEQQQQSTTKICNFKIILKKKKKKERRPLPQLKDLILEILRRDFVYAQRHTEALSAGGELIQIQQEPEMCSPGTSWQQK